MIIGIGIDLVECNRFLDWSAFKKQRIFTKNELRLLKTNFTQGAKNIHAFFDLLYRASTDGDYEEIAKSIVRDKIKSKSFLYPSL